jgi:hypothetical protein
MLLDESDIEKANQEFIDRSPDALRNLALASQCVDMLKLCTHLPNFTPTTTSLSCGWRSGSSILPVPAGGALLQATISPLQRTFAT